MRKTGMARWVGAAGTVAAVVAAQAGIGLATAAPASALPGITIVSKRADQASSAAKQTLTVDCPTGKRVIGGGGEIILGAGKVMVTALQPIHTAAVDSYKIEAEEVDEGNASNWRLQVYAICANPVPNLSIVQTSNVPSSSDFQLQFASCPAGQKVIGTGGRVSGGQGQVTLEEAIPTDNAVLAAGYEDADHFAGTWGLTSYAICANAIPGLKIVQGSTNNAPASFKVATATCNGGRVHAASVAINAGDGNPVLDTVRPSLNTVTVIGRLSQPSSQNWSIVAFAVCAD